MENNEKIKILIVKLSSFGDIVHTLPAFMLLRGSLPGARIEWLVEKRFAPLLGLVKGIDKIHSADTFAWRRRLFSPKTLGDIGRLRKALRTASFDLAIDFQGLLKSAALAKISGAGIRVGFARRFLKERAAAYLYNKRITPDTLQANVVFKNISLAEGLIAGIREWYPSYKINIIKTAAYVDCTRLFSPNPAAVRITADGLKNAGIKDFALLHTGSSSPNKLLPVETQARLCDLLWTERRLAPVLCGSGKDIENARRIVSLCRSSKPFILETSSIAELAEAMRLSYVFIGPDSGPLHLAAALGAKVIGYYGPTDPKRNGPLGKNAKIIEPASGCRKPSCWKKCTDNACLKYLDAQAVLNEID
jgi:lipopolysaccharide heptosyltransferase I